MHATPYRRQKRKLRWRQRPRHVSLASPLLNAWLVACPARMNDGVVKSRSSEIAPPPWSETACSPAASYRMWAPLTRPTEIFYGNLCGPQVRNVERGRERRVGYKLLTVRNRLPIICPHRAQFAHGNSALCIVELVASMRLAFTTRATRSA